jgi:hypothetical protein
MTDEQQSSAFFLYLAILKLNVTILYAIGFIAVLVSIATGHLELTTFSIWGTFGVFVLDRYASHLIVVNSHKVTRWVDSKTKELS